MVRARIRFCDLNELADDHSSLSDTASVHTYIKKGDLGAISATEPSSAVPISKVERHTSVPHFGVFCILV